MKRLFFLFTFNICSTLALCQENLITSSDKNKIDSQCQEYLNSNDIPGMSIGIIKYGKIIYKTGYGVTSIGTSDSISTTTTFHMASISKPFVSIAIMQLVERGKIQLDDHVTKYLPYFRMADKRFEEITIKQLMLHTSGIPDIGPSENYDWGNPQYDVKALERFVKSIKTWKLEFKPGKKCRYSNTGYNLLGDILAKVSGLTFEEYLDQNILNPLGMVHSSFYFPDIDTSNYARPHISQEGHTVVSDVYPYNRAHCPSGTLNASIDDMCKFTICVLNHGIRDNIEIYNKETHRQLTTSLVRRNKIIKLSLGWEIAPFRNTTRIDFSGRDVGFNTYLMMVPSQDFAIILLINHFDVPPAFKVINTAYDIAMNY